VGPMDLTPMGCSPKKYIRTTTAAHELAAALIFTSGLIHYADRPEFFESLPPEALAVLRDAPARWDETRCLEGEPGKVVVFARRTGQSWFVSGINGTSQPLPVTLDLAPFAKQMAGANSSAPRCLLIAEGNDAKMQLAVTLASPSDHWKHELPPRGGFILRIKN
ncbi:MAG TPA: glycoside hydrolase family 97 C-terminal domain-containing protein, partial [Candidatus Sulfotelmatobacter sp.]|nr:glycoside hydrolase family 97 C-terminal domain-containing protein [Candidatus Sulfotelmatobacter sp.]